MLILPWYSHNSGFRIDPVEPHGQRTSTTRHSQDRHSQDRHGQDPTLIIHGREWCASPSLEMPMWSNRQRSGRAADAERSKSSFTLFRPLFLSHMVWCFEALRAAQCIAKSCVCTHLVFHAYLVAACAFKPPPTIFIGVTTRLLARCVTSRLTRFCLALRAHVFLELCPITYYCSCV